jgi:hypothetical protein
VRDHKQIQHKLHLVILLKFHHAIMEENSKSKLWNTISLKWWQLHNCLFRKSMVLWVVTVCILETAQSFSETLGSVQTTWCYNLEHHTFYSHCHENLSSSCLFAFDIPNYLPDSALIFSHTNLNHSLWGPGAHRVRPWTFIQKVVNLIPSQSCVDFCAHRLNASFTSAKEKTLGMWKNIGSIVNWCPFNSYSLLGGGGHLNI